MRTALLILSVFVQICFATVSDSETTREYFTCGAATTTFTSQIKCNSADDVNVYKRLISTGVETELTETTDYTIAATSGSYLNGFTVTISPALGVTYQVVVEREIKKSQETSSGSVNPNTIVTALDKLTRQIQDLETLYQRCLKIPVSDASSLETEVSSSVDRASKNLTFDASGNVTATTVVSTGSVSATSIGEDIITASDAAAVRTLLGITAETGIFSLNDYGAVGDGATDDYTAIAACIAAALAYPNGMVVGAPGTYITGTQIDITGGIILNLPGVTFKQADSAELSIVLNIDVGDNDDLFINVGVDGNMDNNTASVTGCVLKDIAVSLTDIYVGAEYCDIGVEVTGNCEANVMNFTANHCGIGVYEYVLSDTASPDENTFVIAGHTNTTHYKKDNYSTTGRKSTSIVHLSCETASGDAVYIADNCTANDYVCLSGEIRGCASNGVHVGTGGARVNFDNLFADGKDVDWGVVIDSSSGITGDVTLSNFDGGVYVKSCSYGNLGITTSAIGDGVSPDAALKLGVESTSSAQRFTVKPGSVLYTNRGSYGVHLVQSYNTVILNSYIFGLTYNVYFDSVSNNDTVYVNGRSLVSGAETNAKYAAHSSATDPRLIIDGLYTTSFTSADTTPSTLGYTTFKTNSSIATSITDFDKCYTGQIITIIGNDSGNTTIVHDATKINLANSKNVTLQNNDTIQLYYDGTDWNEIARADSGVGNEFLLSVTTIADLSSVAATTLYTVPTGKKLVLTEAWLKVEGDVGANLAFTVGQAAALTDWVGTTNGDNLDADEDVIIIKPVPSATPSTNKMYPAGTVIKIDVAVGGNAVAGTVYLYGFLI